MSQVKQQAEPAVSGDLTRRKLVPALHTMACEGFLPAEVRVIGVARSSLSDETFRQRLYEGEADELLAQEGRGWLHRCRPHS